MHAWAVQEKRPQSSQKRKEKESKPIQDQPKAAEAPGTPQINGRHDAVPTATPTEDDLQLTPMKAPRGQANDAKDKAAKKRCNQQREQATRGTRRPNHCLAVVAMNSHRTDSTDSRTSDAAYDSAKAPRAKEDGHRPPEARH